MRVFKMFKYIELSVKCKIRSVIRFLNARNMSAIDFPDKFVKFMDRVTFHHSKKERKKHVEFRNKIILGCCVCFFLITKQPLLKKTPCVHTNRSRRWLLLKVANHQIPTAALQKHLASLILSLLSAIKAAHTLLLHFMPCSFSYWRALIPHTENSVRSETCSAVYCKNIK